VTNTGRVEGKEVVEIYVTTPYTSGKIEKPFVTLAGYGKTKSLKPGENQTITVSINVQDMASYDYTDANANGNKGYELDPGDYIIRAMSTSHVDLAAAPSKNDDYDDRKFTIKSAKAINIKLDDFSGNEIKNLFSKENGAFYSLRTGLNVDSNANEILMSRANFDGTFPRQYSTADLTLTKDFTDAIAYLDGFDADDQAKYADKTTDPWYVPAATVPATWTQAAAAAKGNTTILSQMSGINPFDRSAGQVAWQNFMNQLSWNELTSIVNAGGHQTVAVPSIAKAKSSDENGPNGLSNSHAFCDETVIASTWNVELAEAEGKMIGNFGMFLGISGWYGPGMNTHRSPFGGRCNEYYSQDGIQGGYIASAVVGGAQSKGLNCYIKHFLINDQETNRNGECLFTWLSEQAFRENYLKVFQMAMQEGGATASMTAFARIGRIPTADHYNLLTKLVREEWGWHGYFVTDAYGGCRASCPMDLIIRAGNDLPDGTATGAGVVSGAWNPALRGGKGDVEVGTTTKSENYLQYYYVRMCAMRVLYLACNSQNNLNGINFAGYTGGTIGSVTQSVPLTPMSVAVSAPNLHGSTATYAVTSGTLPAGLTLSSTGAITGIPTADAGAYAFVVTCTADGWIKKTANYAVTVNAK
jgi:beta-glucosidase